jgi:hypothetical protein
MGESLRRSGRLPLAETAFKIAKIFEPGEARAQVGLAVTVLGRGDMKKAEELVSSVKGDKENAVWFAELAYYSLENEKFREARTALAKSLELDPSNLLARQLDFIMTREAPDRDDAKGEESLRKLLALNKPPIFMEKDSLDSGSIVWKPEMGAYQEGQKASNGWWLFSEGFIQQPVCLPPGKVRFSISASGTKVGGVGPILSVAWSGKQILTTEVKTQFWSAYDIETSVKPGEFLLSIGFINDQNDPVTREDRNLKLEKVVVSWEAL